MIGGILLCQFYWMFLVDDGTPMAWPQGNDWYCLEDVIAPSYNFGSIHSCTIALFFMLLWCILLQYEKELCYYECTIGIQQESSNRLV